MVSLPYHLIRAAQQQQEPLPCSQSSQEVRSSQHQLPPWPLPLAQRRLSSPLGYLPLRLPAYARVAQRQALGDHFSILLAFCAMLCSNSNSNCTQGGAERRCKLQRWCKTNVMSTILFLAYGHTHTHTHTMWSMNLVFTISRTQSSLTKSSAKYDESNNSMSKKMSRHHAK